MPMSGDNTLWQWFYLISQPPNEEIMLICYIINPPFFGIIFSHTVFIAVNGEAVYLGITIFAIPKRPIADSCYTVRNIHTHKTCALSKCTIANTCNAFRNSYTCQTCAVIKRITADSGTLFGMVTLVRPEQPSNA